MAYLAAEATFEQDAAHTRDGYVRRVTRVGSRAGRSGAKPVVPGLCPLRVRLRMIHHGRMVLEGGVVTDTAVGYPELGVGQHIIVSAFFGELANAWLPWGFFEVREGRVVSLQPDHLRVKDYDSVDAFAAALANPPPTVTR